MDTPSRQQTPVHSNGDDGDARSEFLRNRAIVNAILSGMPVAEAARHRRPVPIAERTEPARVDVTVPAKPHKVSKDGCITQKGIAG